MSNNPPGWYADPFGRAQVRWWSGSGWTDHCATSGQEFIDPPVASPVAAPTAAAPAQPAAPTSVSAPTMAGVAKTPTPTLALVAVAALLVGGLAGWVLRGDGDGGGAGGGGGGGAAGSLTTPILQGFASLNSYEYSLVLNSVGPTANDRSDATTTGAVDNSNGLSHLTLDETSVAADDPEPSTSNTETWRTADVSCTFDGEEYTSEAASPFEVDLNTVLSGVFDIVIPAGNATLVGDETMAGVAAKHWTFTIQGLGAESGAQVEANSGEVWVAKDGGYLLKYQVTASLRSDAASSEVSSLTLTLELTSVNQPVNIQVPAACPAPTTVTT